MHCAPQLAFTELVQENGPLSDAAEALCSQEFGHGLKWGENKVFAATAGEAVLGLTNVIVFEGGAANIRYIVVDPEQRGRGIGSMLLTGTLTELRTAGHVKVSITPRSARNKRLYERYGFSYPDPNALTMFQKLDARSGSRLPA